MADPPEKGETTTPAKRDELTGRALLWAMSPGSAFEFVAVVFVIGTVVGWTAGVLPAKEIWAVFAMAATMFEVGRIVRRVRT